MVPWRALAYADLKDRPQPPYDRGDAPAGDAWKLTPRPR
jgi:hypothetical protein